MKKLLSWMMTLTAIWGLACSAGAEKTLTFTFTGDVTLGSEEANWEKPESFNGYAEREGYGWFFRNMKELFSKDDLTLVNLEGVLSDQSWGEVRSKTFRFRGPTDYVKILTESAIEACNISNNHIMDYGAQGYDSTLATLKGNGIQVCGNDQFFLFEKDGIRVGFFGLTNGFMNEYRDTVKNAIAQMRADGVNAIVCCFHSGQEYSLHRRDWDQERYAKWAIEDWGADLVVMHHPHVIQGVEIRNNRYIFYSLGNFCFGGNMVIRGERGKKFGVRTLESMVLQMDLRFDDDGTYLGQEGRIYPCYISSSASDIGDPNDFQPKFVTGEEALRVFERIQYDTRFDLGTPDPKTYVLSLPFLRAPAESAENTDEGA